MKLRTAFLLVICLCCSPSPSNQDTRPKIVDFTGREIRITDDWAGQTMTLINEEGTYYMLRKFLGSGVPVIGTARYKTVFDSDYKITFSEIEELTVDSSMVNFHEVYSMKSEETGPCIYLNRLKLVTE